MLTLTALVMFLWAEAVENREASLRGGTQALGAQVGASCAPLCRGKPASHWSSGSKKKELGSFISFLLENTDSRLWGSYNNVWNWRLRELRLVCLVTGLCVDMRSSFQTGLPASAQWCSRGSRGDVHPLLQRFRGLGRARTLPLCHGPVSFLAFELNFLTPFSFVKKVN